MKILEHEMKVVEGVLEKRLHRMVIVNKIQFGFMNDGGIINPVSILRWLQEEYHAKGKTFYVLCAPIESF